MQFARLSALCGLLLALCANGALAQKYVCMESNKGEWCMEMLRSAAPVTVDNFLRYVNNGDYTHMFLHRSVPGFVVQGGGFGIDPQGFLFNVRNYGTIVNEYRRSNVRGTVAMAKLGGNVNSASNQWFVNLANNSANLDNQNGGFTVFAEIVYGMDVIDRIAGFRVGNVNNIFGESALGEVPLDIPQTATSVDRKDFVLITRAYTTDVLPGQTIAPYHCTPVVPNETLTELCAGAVSFPVNVQGIGPYEVTLQLQATKPDMVFAIKAGTLKPIASLPASAATYNPATQVLTIPSVRNGANFYFNVQLKLTSAVNQQFTLQSFSLP